MSKERLFYLDFVRAIAAVSILITHYNAIFLYMNPPITNCYVIDAYVFNIYIGSFGVSLFLIISGAALMYVYENRLELRKFYLKRFKSIYPMFWLAYTIAFLYAYVYCHGWENSLVPRKYLILSLFGFDGYLAEIMPTYYLVGEWFLGFIILFYIIFPLLRYLINKYPIILCTVVMIIYIYLLFHYNMRMSSAKNIFIRLPEILFGMMFIKYRKKIKLPVVLICILILTLNHIFKPQFSQDIQTTYIGVASFIILVYISYYVKNDIIKSICAWLSKYSYAIFLVHHIVIYYIMGTFDLYAMTHLQSYLVFIGLCSIILVLSRVLYEIDKYINILFSNIKKIGNEGE